MHSVLEVMAVLLRAEEEEKSPKAAAYLHTHFFKFEKYPLFLK